MVFYPDVNQFVVKNLSDIEKIVRSVSFSKDPFVIEESVQNACLQLLSRDVVNKFDPEHIGADGKPSDLSSYVFSTIKNSLIHEWTNESRNHNKETYIYDPDLMDSLTTNSLDTEYQIQAEYNEIAEAINSDFEDFGNFLRKNRKYNKVWRLNRSLGRKLNPDGDRLSFSVLSFLYCLKLGYKQREVSSIFGITQRLVGEAMALLKIAYKMYLQD